MLDLLAKTPRGTTDILPSASQLWQYIEGQLADIFALFGYKEIRTPVFEETELFERGIGEATDIVAFPSGRKVPPRWLGLIYNTSSMASHSQ